MVLSTCHNRDVPRQLDNIFALTKGIYVEFLVNVLTQVKPQQKRDFVARGMFSRLSKPEDQEEFAQTNMHEKTVHDQYLVTLNHLEYYQLDPLLVIDHVHHVNSKLPVLRKFGH